MSEERIIIKINQQEREFIHIATTTVGVVGAGCVALPLVTQMNPDASVKALAKVELISAKLIKVTKLQ